MSDGTSDGTVTPLAGRVALVTGAGQNLGKAIALHAARAGASVAVNALNDVDSVDRVVAQIREEGGVAIPVLGDVTDPAVVPRLFESARREFGPITIVVHCAAARGPHLPIDEIDADTWRRVVAVAIDGAFLCAQAALPDMQSEAFGRLVFISGPAAHLGRPDGSTHGATGKAALEGLVRAIAQEHGHEGITSNVLSLGALATDRTRDLTYSGGWDPIQAATIKRLITLEEAAAICVDLCSTSHAAVNGVVVHADGGMIARV
jgi:3-oxoacyl-[acyl-carrier protein] reductase